MDTWFGAGTCQSDDGYQSATSCIEGISQAGHSFSILIREG